MEYLNTKQIAIKWNTNERRVRTYCINGRIIGAKRLGKAWMIPSNALKPIDARYKDSKAKSNINSYHFPFLIFSNCYSDTSLLDEEYLRLLEAQKEYLKGNFIKSNEIAFNLIEDSNNNYIKFGCYAVACLNCMLLGIGSQFNIYLNELNELVNKEEVYKEDLKLIIAEIKYTITWNVDFINEIDNTLLSNEALIFYYCQLVMRDGISGIKQTKEQIERDTIFTQNIDNLKIHSASILLHNSLSIVYLRVFQDKDKALYHTKLAYKIANDNGYISYYAKYYIVNKKTTDLIMTLKQRSEMNQLANRNLTNFRLITNQTPKLKILEKLDLKYLELVNLISQDLSDKAIMNTLRISRDEYKEKIDYLLKINKFKNKKQLVEYYSKAFSKD